MRFISEAILFGVLFWTLMGCAVEKRRGIEYRDVSREHQLYDTVDFRRANLLRAHATEELKVAYGAEDPGEKVEAFDKAIGMYRQAQEIYFRALKKTERHYHSIIEAEIKEVDSYIEMCMRDRPVLDFE